MSDYNSSLPVRTENAGDVISKLCDATTPSQQLAIDASGNASVKVKNAAADPAAVEVIVSGAAIDPRDQGTPNSIANRWPVQGTDGTNSQSYLAGGEAKVAVTQPLPAGTNVIGDVNANLQDGAGNDITSQTNGAQRALDVGINVGGVQIDPRQIRALTASDVVSANVRDASGNAFSNTNPLPVAVVEAVGGTDVLDYATSVALGAGSSVDHTYTVTALKTLSLSQLWASGSGKIKMEFKIETGVGTNVFQTKLVGFNSTATPNIDKLFGIAVTVAAGVRIRMTITNRDNQAQDVYSTFVGTEF